MAKEFYHKDIFGSVVDIDLQAEEMEGATPAKASAGYGRDEFNVFSITDAFGRRNKKEAWLLYQKALASGISAEEVFFRLFWQVKSMLIVLKTSSIRETDMKPYPYNKAKGFLKNFDVSELEKLSEDLIIGYHNARLGKGEMNTLVERVLLSL